MTVNEFNSKVNLPKLYAGLGVTGYKFVKIPYFGWYAFNDTSDSIMDCFDIFNMEEATSLYRTLTLEKSGYLDFRIRYSELNENTLSSNLVRKKGWDAFWKSTKDQAETGKIHHNRKTAYLRDVLEDQGYPKLINQGKIGLINDNVLSKFKYLKIPSEFRNKLVVPSFVTPKHICSLSVANISNLGALETLYKNQEHGWFGTIGNDIVPDIRGVGVLGGFTWDHKADFWTRNVVTSISPNIDPATILKIWSEAKQTEFSNNPLKVLKGSVSADELQHYIKDLTYSQIRDLESVFEKEFISTWKNLREQQITIGSLLFTKRHNQYFLTKNANTIPFTNFTIEIDRIEKKDGSFYRIGHIYCRDSIIPFSIDTKHFSNNKRFMLTLTNIMFEAGVGVPLVTTNYQSYLLDVINLFNEEAIVSASPPS